MPVAIPVGAELDERSATAAAEKARRVFADAGRDAGRAFGTGLGQADEGLRKFEKQAKDSYDRAADAAGKLRSEEEKLQDLRDRGARNSQVVSQAERVEKARRAEARAVRDATDALKDYDNAAKDAGKGAVAQLGGAGRDAANEFVGGFMGASTAGRLAVAVAGAGAGAGAAFAGAFVGAVTAGVGVLAISLRDGLPVLQMRDQFQAAMGLDEASMARYANAAGQAYANNFGASVADNLAAARTALQSGLVAPGSSDADVQGVIEQVQGVSQVTGASAEELSRSVTQLMRTGFAGSVSDALDIITAGFQDGLDVSHDWLDSINEYSTQFRKLGLDAGDWMTLLKQGLEGGARDTDKVADSLKEFSIRAVDGSKTTAEGFKALGFDADEMGRRFAEGGESAKTAFGAVLEALRNTGDAQQQALIWQRLFGTQFEDMGDAINKLNLDPAANQFRDLQGTSDNATKTASSNFKSEWEEATRTVGQYFSDLKTDIADGFTTLPVIRDIPDLIKTAFTPSDRPTGYFDPNLKPDPNRTGNMLLPPDLRVGAPPPGAPPGGNAPAIAGPLGPFAQWLPGAGPTTPASGAPVAGDRTPIVPDDGSGAAKKTKPSFDPSQYSVDAIPVPGAVPGTGLPPVQMTQLPTGPGSYQVDPQRVYDAETSLMSARNSVESARIRVLELEADGTATAQDLNAARNGVTMAERGYTSAQMKLAEAQQGTWKKMEGAAKSFGQGMDQIGVALDNDLGISKGLPGLAENLVKFVGSLAAAPLEAQLAAISKYNPIQGGHGLLGMLGAQGVFGPQYTQSQYGQQGYGYGPAAAQGGISGPPSEAQVKQIASAFGLQVTSEDRPGDPGYHGQGMALDVSNGSGNTPQMRAFAEYMSQNFGPYLKELIYSDGSFSGLIGDGKNVTGSSYYGPDTLSEHQNHVHVAAQWGTGLDTASSALTGLASAANSATGALAGSGSASGGAESWRSTVASVVDKYGPQMGITAGNRQQWIDAIVSQIDTESKGNPNADNPNDSNGQGGRQHVAGLLQYLPSSYANSGGKLTGLPYMDPVGQIAGALFAPRNADGSPSLTAPGGIGAGHGWGPVDTPILGGPSLAGVPSMPGGMMPGVGAPQAAPFARTPGTGGIAFPATPGGGGIGLSGDGAIGMAMQAGGMALDMMAPGAGQAAQIGMKLANRAIQFGGQAAGIGVSGLMETFLPSGSPLGNIGNSWFGKLAAGFAGARPALPNTAAQQAPTNPNAQGQQGQQGGGSGTTIEKLEFNNNEATQGSGVNDVARAVEAQHSPAGVR